MGMQVKSIFLLLLIAVQHFKANNSECVLSSQKDNQCSAYCYQVTKHLLRHVARAHEQELKFGELEKKIHEQELQLASLKAKQELHEEIINGKNKELAIQAELIAEYKAQLAAKEAAVEKTKLIAVEQLPCAVTDSGWTDILRREDAAVSFNRTWKEYSAGFGDPNGSFFVGLERIYQLTKSMTHELHIVVRNWNGETRCAHYDDFKIGSEAEHYELKSLGRYSGTAGNALKDHLHMKFSTIDRDNDEFPLSCASEWSSGWWFKFCLKW
ncbi:hypothetical protein KR222_007215 [Zaprionus bogoriensis]|nr:hypothetical protein KR222_007215 [Zaprionus bogoriensis]